VQFQRQSLTQEQRQKLSPQMLQSIKLMAMPVQDLVDKIQEELEANPALEVLEERKAVSLDDVPERDTEVESYFEASSDSGYRPSAPSEEGDSKRMFLEGAVSRSETLQDHLLWQLRLQPISDRQRQVGEILISNLNSDGFHIDDPEKAFAEEEREALRPLIAATLEMIRGFEPVGCCSKDYKESLLVQVRLHPDSPPEAESLVGEHLDLIERGKYQDLARKLKIDDERLQCLLEFVKSLTPFPGRLYSNEETSYAIPDVMVKPKDGDFVIILNDEEIPVLGISPFMDRLGRTDIRKSAPKPVEGRDKEAAEYARHNLRDARFFIQSIQQRNRTLLKVARSVVEFQRGFFMQGPKYLVPLTLKDIATEIGVHETTVSRIANKKYVQTEWGIFELRYFFTNSISGSGSSGSRFSKGGVKEVIREIIENETAPLSDQGISELLAARGIKIARRTVAKYRHELKMNTSFSR
jgi:RNA polymerase sigma-54 factor